MTENEYQTKALALLEEHEKFTRKSIEDCEAERPARELEHRRWAGACSALTGLIIGRGAWPTPENIETAVRMSDELLAELKRTEPKP